MASLVYVNAGSQLGADLLNALDQVRNGFSLLHKLDGRRAQTIALNDGGATFGSVFGIADNAQAMSDRLAAIEGGNFTGLPDLLDATLRQVI